MTGVVGGRSISADERSTKERKHFSATRETTMREYTNGDSDSDDVVEYMSLCQWIPFRCYSIVRGTAFLLGTDSPSMERISNHLHTHAPILSFLEGWNEVQEIKTSKLDKLEIKIASCPTHAAVSRNFGERD